MSHERKADLIETAFKIGAKLDDYKDNFSIWKEAMEELNISEKDYLGARELDAVLPWDIVEQSEESYKLLHEAMKQMI